MTSLIGTYSYRLQGTGASQATLSAHPGIVQSVVGSVSLLFRSFMNSTPIQQIMGYSTVMNLIAGSLDAQQGLAQRKITVKWGGEGSARQEELHVIEGAARSMAGGSAAFNRVANTLQLIRSTPSLSTAAKVSGIVGDGAFCVSFGMGIFLAGQRWFRNSALRSVLLSYEGSDQQKSIQGMRYLLEQSGHILSCYVPELLRTESRQSLHKQGKEALALVGLDLADLERQSYLDVLELEESPLTLLELVGLFALASQRGLVARHRFEQIVGSQCMERISQAARRGLWQRLDTTGELYRGALREYQILSSSVMQTIDQNQRREQWSVVMYTVALISAILSVLAIVGALSTPPLWLTLVLVVLMGVVDMNGLQRVMTQRAEGKHDAAYLLLISFVLIMTFVMSCGATILFHLPLLDLLRAGIICLVGLGINARALFLTHQRPKHSTPGVKYETVWPQERMLATLVQTEAGYEHLLSRVAEELKERWGAYWSHASRSRFQAIENAQRFIEEIQGSKKAADHKKVYQAWLHFAYADSSQNPEKLSHCLLPS